MDSMKEMREQDLLKLLREDLPRLTLTKKIRKPKLNKFKAKELKPHQGWTLLLLESNLFRLKTKRLIYLMEQ